MKWKKKGTNNVGCFAGGTAFERCGQHPCKGFWVLLLPLHDSSAPEGTCWPHLRRKILHKS